MRWHENRLSDLYNRLNIYGWYSVKILFAKTFWYLSVFDTYVFFSFCFVWRETLWHDTVYMWYTYVVEVEIYRYRNEPNHGAFDVGISYLLTACSNNVLIFEVNIWMLNSLMFRNRVYLSCKYPVGI